MQDMGKMLVLLGFILVIFGSLLFFAGKIPLGFLGKLPGDISYHKNNITVFAPITSMIVISIILTVVVNLISRWLK